MFFFVKKNQKTFFGLVTLLLGTAAHAQPSLRQACAPDYHKFCEGLFPGTAAIRTCFAQNLARLAPACQAAIAATRVAREADETRRATATGDTLAQTTVNGVARSYLVHVPPQKPAGGFAVIFAFHGAGGQGAGMIGLTHFDKLADQRGFIAVYPNGIDRHWNDGRSTITAGADDVGFTRAMIGELTTKYSVNAAQIYATGFSNGAMLTQRLGCELADRISAIAPVSGGLPEDLAPRCHPAKPVSVLYVAGTADPIVPFSGGAVSTYGGLGVGGNVLSAEATASIWAATNGCARGANASVLPPTGPLDGTAVSRTLFAPCKSGRAVTLLVVKGGGHTWPGGPQYLPASMIGPASTQVDASAAIVDFFLAQAPR